MLARMAVLMSLGLLLASCAGFGQCPGYGPCTGRAMSGPYDLADLYSDPLGFPIPGFADFKYGGQGEHQTSN